MNYVTSDNINIIDKLIFFKNTPGFKHVFLINIRDISIEKDSLDFSPISLQCRRSTFKIV